VYAKSQAIVSFYTIFYTQMSCYIIFHWCWEWQMTRLKTHRLLQGVNNVVRPTMNKLSTMLFQVVTVEQCCNNMLEILFILGRGKYLCTSLINYW
jgi:hypothetical protein